MSFETVHPEVGEMKAKWILFTVINGVIIQ